jgi:hypothetical protein
VAGCFGFSIRIIRKCEEDIMQKILRMVSAVALTAVLAFAPSAHAAVSWSELQLVDASGVPNEPSHGYWFKGILALWHTKTTSSTSLEVSFTPVKFSSTSGGVVDATIWVQGKGKWNEKTGEAEEHLVFEGNDAAGKFASRMKCTKDPWIYPASCVVLSAQYKVSKGKNWDFPGMVQKWKRPLTQPVVTLAAAESLSSKHKSAAPVPPPPPPATDPPKKLSSPKKETSAPPAQPPVALVSVKLPDIASDSGIVVGTKAVQWGGIVAVSASEARRVHDGQCEFAIRHTARNAGASSAGPFGRRWTNSNVGGAWGMTYPSIPPNGTVERVDTLPLKPGRNTLYLTLDSGNAVTESNEGNNLYRISVDLSGACGPTSTSTPPAAAGGRLQGS